MSFPLQNPPTAPTDCRNLLRHFQPWSIAGTPRNPRSSPSTTSLRPFRRVLRVPNHERDPKLFLSVRKRGENVFDLFSKQSLRKNHHRHNIFFEKSITADVFCTVK
uniref:(northern house mosquito) hypothetical protein n=1 Tax=Culex pipiens TaxID=7175 RepID=A0A8D8CBP9_CULPI